MGALEGLPVTRIAMCAQGKPHSMIRYILLQQVATAETLIAWGVLNYIP